MGSCATKTPSTRTPVCRLQLASYRLGGGGLAIMRPCEVEAVSGLARSPQLGANQPHAAPRYPRIEG